MKEPTPPSRVAWEGAAYLLEQRTPGPGPDRVRAVIRLLEEQHGSADLGNLSDPIEELVWIPLTRQTHRQNSLRSWKRIQKLGGPCALLNLPVEELVALLKDAGFSRQKAHWIKGALAQVVGRFGQLNMEKTASWSDEEVESFLVSLPGINIKSAKCVMMYSLGRKVLPVDTHLRRLAERLAWVQTGLSERQIHEALEAVVPPDERTSLHVNAIWHGRVVCRAIRPRCGECVARWACAYGINEA